MSFERTLELDRVESFMRRGGAQKRRDAVIAFVEAGDIEDALVVTRLKHASTIYGLLKGGSSYRDIERYLKGEGFSTTRQEVRITALRLRAFGIPISLSTKSKISL